MTDSCLYTPAGGMGEMHVWQNNHSKTHPSRMQVSPNKKEILSSTKPNRNHSTKEQQVCRLFKESKSKP